MALDLLQDDSACTAQAPVLLVLLPGANMQPAEMVEQGMVQALRTRQLAVDVVVAGAGLEYLYDGSVFERLRSDLIDPYRTRGYRRIWLAGISLGGFVALGYAQRHPAQIEGIVALAPYLGRSALLQDIAAAGGPARWRVGAAANNAEGAASAADADHALWMGLSARSAGAPALHLGGCRALGRACVEAETGLSLGAKHSHTKWYGEHLQRRISPVSASTLRAGEIFGATRRCRLVVGTRPTPLRRLGWHRNSPRRRLDPKPDSLLGYGRDDRFAAGHQLLAQTLPPQQVATAAGGHDWSAWRPPWSDWLDKRLLPLACKP